MVRSSANAEERTMSTVRKILAKKGPHVFTIGKHATVLEGALLMNEHRIGALVVVEAGQGVGMFTERDVLQRVVAEKRDPAKARVGEGMTTESACAPPETTIEEARGAMKTRRIRHLPLVDENRRLLGLISIGDLNAHDAAASEH